MLRWRTQKKCKLLQSTPSAKGANYFCHLPSFPSKTRKAASNKPTSGWKALT